MSELNELSVPCSTCGADVDMSCAEWCVCEMDSERAEAISAAVESLALSIRRFVRRAEVEGLVSTLSDVTGHFYHCYSLWKTNGRTCTCGGDERYAALLRLAELAKEGA